MAKPFVLAPGRVKCEVIGCRRTAKEEPGVFIICGKCWRANSTAEDRRVWSRFHREAVQVDTKLCAMHDAGMDIPDDMAARYDRCRRTAHAAWQTILDRANAAATGL